MNTEDICKKEQLLCVDCVALRFESTKSQSWQKNVVLSLNWPFLSSCSHLGRAPTYD